MSRRRSALPLVTLLVPLLVVAGLLGTAVPGSAAPAPSASQVRARLATLTVSEEKVTEAYDAANVALVRAEQNRGMIELRVAALTGAAGIARVRMGQLAAAAYESGGGLPVDLSVIDAGGPQGLADRASDLQLVSRVQAQTASRLGQILAGLRSSEQAAATAEALEVALHRALGADRAHLASTISGEQALLTRLTAITVAAPVHAALAITQTGTGAAPAAPAAAPPAVSGSAGAAVRFAYAQLGKPYQWGSAGPNSYDCSGLTMASWAAAGVSLPHSSQDQQAMLAPVPAGQLQPGDLIFFGSPAYHVGIYIGNGQMIHAPHTGTDVQISPISGYSSAGRP